VSFTLRDAVEKYNRSGVNALQVSYDMSYCIKKSLKNPCLPLINRDGNRIASHRFFPKKSHLFITEIL